MRHLWSLVAGVVAAPLVWILVALGQDGSTRTITGWVEADTYNTARLIEATVYLAVAGIVLGLIATLRVSPLGAGAAGALLMAPYIGMYLAPLRVRSAVPGHWNLFGDPLPLRLPLDNGTLLLIGMLLFVAVFSTQRWRRWPVPGGSAGGGLVDTDPDVFSGDRPLLPTSDPDTRTPTLAYPPRDDENPAAYGGFGSAGSGAGSYGTAGGSVGGGLGGGLGGSPGGSGSPWTAPPPGVYRRDGTAE